MLKRPAVCWIKPDCQIKSGEREEMRRRSKGEREWERRGKGGCTFVDFSLIVITLCPLVLIGMTKNKISVS